MGDKLTKTQRTGLFYGWWIAIAASSMSFLGGGSFIYGMAVFFDPIRQHFGWSYTATSLGYSLRTMETGIAAPIFGFLSDRYGARKLLLLGISLAGIGFILLSITNSLATYYIYFIILSTGWAPVLGVVNVRAVANWFRRKASRAMGIVLMGTAAGGLLPPLIVQLVETFGWRSTLLQMGVAILVLGIPLCLVVRDRPEDSGYLPDGDTVPANADTQSGALAGAGALDSPTNPQMGLGEALKTTTFWLLALVFTVAFGLTNVIITHHMAYLSTIGVSSTEAVWLLTIFSFVGIPIRLLIGWLGDMMDKRKLLAALFFLGFFGVLTMAMAQSLWHLVVYAVTLGISWNGLAPLRSSIQLQYFGSKAYGSILGLFFTIITVGGFLAPVLAGWIYDTTGSYRPAFYIMAAAMLAATPLFLLVRPPRVSRPG